jgi:P-type conjugative transfer protein TrbJ
MSPMQRRKVFGSVASGALAAPAVLLPAPRQAEAFFGGGGGGVDTAAIVAALKIIEDILNSRFAEMLEASAVLATLKSVTEQLNGLLDLYSQARGLFYTLDAIALTFNQLYTAAKDLDFTRIRASELQLMSRLKTLSRQAANIQASVVSSTAWEVATTQLLTTASRGTTSVTGQLQILNQLAGQLSSQSTKVQALLSAQTGLMSEQLAERELIREQSDIISERFWAGFRTEAEDAQQLRLPGILD